MRRLLLAMLLLLLILFVAKETRGEAPPLKDLPSAPGPHVAKIKALGDGEWLLLGAPAPDPTWGPAPGRAYTNKMAYAPDLVGGFLFGEGVHGKSGEGPREGHYNDDVFFYDLMAHRYLCVYPGTDVEQFEVHRDDAGFLASPDGQHRPIAIAVHGYECSSYNPHTREFMAPLTGSPYSREIDARRRALVAEQPVDGRNGGGQHPFFYNVDTGRWTRRRAEAPGLRTSLADALIYVPSLKKSVLYQRRGDFWFFDHEKSQWEHVVADGGRPETVDGRPSAEGALCYDSRRDRLYVFNRDQASIPWAYDFRTNTFSDLKAKNQFYPPTNSYEQGRLSIGSTSSGVHYDTAADVVVMRMTVRQGSGDPRNLRGATKGLAIYDPTTNAWSEQPVALPPDLDIRGAWNSFYSPELNVHVYHIAGDSRTNGRVLLYRHKRKAT
ncbi:MAG: hypothetical protein RIC55_02965 [Pirellulaceae bacterium]